MNQHWNTANVGGIDIRTKVIGLPDYDIEEPENEEVRLKVEKMLLEERALTGRTSKGGVNFDQDDDLYTLEFETIGMWIENEEE